MEIILTIPILKIHDLANPRPALLWLLPLIAAGSIYLSATAAG